MRRTSRSVYAGATALACTLLVPGSLVAQQVQTAAAATPAPAAQTAAPAAQAPAPRVPVPNRLNNVMPNWLRVRGEFRERMEGFDGLGYNASRDDLYWLTRFRFNATATANKHLSFQAQVQDARVAKKTVGPTGAPFSAPFDLRQGFADVGAATGPFTVRLGRQELVYGEQRLVGHVSWVNAARTFDGVKATYRNKAFSVDAFATSVVRILVDEFDKSGAGNRFTGAYLTAGKLVPQATVEPYVYYRRDVNLLNESLQRDNLHQTTMGLRFNGRLPARLDYGIEMAMQRGSLGSDDISAWGGHWQLRESLPGPGAVKLTGEYNFASGDADSRDGVRGTFDQLYPTPHDKYGLADQIGWRNLHHVRGGFEFTPRRQMPITAAYHSWWLADKNDALYGANSAFVARVPGGAADSHVGQELDIQVSKPLTAQLQFAAGYAHIFTGAFLKEATPGASYSHPYVMVTYVFLAER